MTAKEAADFTNPPSQPEKIKEFLLTAPPREIQKFIHLIGGGQHSFDFHLARTALEIRLAEDADKRADKLVCFTRWLIFFTITLVFIGIIQIIYAH
jgi:hypothetical protein